MINIINSPIGSKSTLLRLESSLASDKGGGPGAEDRPVALDTPPNSGLLPPDTDLHLSPPAGPLLKELPPKLDLDRPL